MKLNFKNVALMAAALLVGLSSCSNNDNLPSENLNNSEPKSVFLKVTNNAPATYAETDPLEATSVRLNNGVLFFFNLESGLIIQRHELELGVLNELQNGKKYENIPGQVNAVCIVGNTDLTSLETATNIADVRNFPISDIVSQRDITNVNLFGQESLQETSGETNKFECTVLLEPTVARFELTKIVASGAITSFEVEGVFIDYYHSMSTVGGNVVGEVANHGTGVNAFIPDNNTGYLIELNEVVYDYYESAMGSDGQNTVQLADSKVWGYNLFAALDYTTAVPRIIIRLKNVQAEGGLTFNGYQFLTIKGFKTSSGSISAIEAGKIYRLTNGIKFDENNLSPTPNVEAFEANVSVELAKWELLDVEAEF